MFRNSDEYVSYLESICESSLNVIGVTLCIGKGLQYRMMVATARGYHPITRIAGN